MFLLCVHFDTCTKLKVTICTLAYMTLKWWALFTDTAKLPPTLLPHPSPLSPNQTPYTYNDYVDGV